RIDHSRPRAHVAAGGRLARRRRSHAFGTLGRHGAARGARALDCARPDADDVRRTLHGARPDFTRRHRPVDPAAQRLARCDFDRRDPRRGRGARTGRLRLLHVRGEGRISRHSRPGARGGTFVASPVRLRRTRWAGPVPLSGAGLSAGPVRAMTGRLAELVRALGPVVAGLLFASRAGSAITAEIGLMKATEQLSAMEMMAVDPIARVVAPRFWAGVISMPLLAALFSAMGVFGGYLVGVRLIGVD